MSGAFDLDHMRRAIALARAALGTTWPNPAVGCVIARGGEVIVQAATAPGGRPHAEEQALAAAGEAARGADAFVTMEPCATRSSGVASCSERLAAAGVARLIYARDNRHELSAGHGPDRLCQAGIPIEAGLLKEEAGFLYAGFEHRLRTGRPLVSAAGQGLGFDGLFEPAPGEALETALHRYGQAGYASLWTPAGGDLAKALGELGLLAP